MVIAKLFRPLASLRIALLCMGLSIVLVFWGTLAQVHLGTYNAQKVFFNSFVVFQKFGSINLPVFPGGLSLGFLWLLNLAAAFVVRFRPTVNKIGLYISHAGLIFLLAGQLLTQLFTIETQLPIEIGQSQNYSESFRDTELVLIDHSPADYDEVTSIPISLVRKKGPIQFARLPFQLHVKDFYPNAQLSMNPPGFSGNGMRGIGARVSVEPAAPVTSDDETNNVTAVIEVIDNGESQGTWLVSSGLGAPQSFHAGGKSYEFHIQPRRHYYPFTLTLKEFHHDIYPGTNIPRNFSSLVHLENPEKKEERDALIYMNHPLRYEGKTFYQASFGNNDTLSVFQVVENPFSSSPYVSCGMILLGLGIHFLMSLTRYLRKNA